MSGYLNNYRPADPALWQGRIDGADADDQRWHQRVVLADLSLSDCPKLERGQRGLAIVGFCSDEGVRRNLGRTGAKDGPDAVRRACAALPVHFDDKLVLLDAGNIYCMGEDLEDAQAALTDLLTTLLVLGYRPLVFGGGHEVVYPNYSGVRDFLQKEGTGKTIGIINFDAHFDLREPGVAGASSGTGFWQIAAEAKAGGLPFCYLPIGIQPHANTARLYQRATELKVNCIEAADFRIGREAQVLDTLQAFMSQADAIYLTIDLDVFAAPYAPGVSAVAPVGLIPDAFFTRMLNTILHSQKLVSMDIAELNPLYDQDGRTARLAAWLAFCAL